jgi:MYXO-CTERM domain-containing protein
LKVPIFPPPVTTYLPVVPPTPQQPPQRPAPLPHPPVVSEPPPVVIARGTPAPVSAAGGSASDDAPQAADLAPPPPPVTPARPNETAGALPVFPQFEAKPPRKDRFADNPQKINTVGSFALSAVGGQDIVSGATAAGPVGDVRSLDGETNAYVGRLHGATLSLSGNEIYVSGDGVYHWRDPENGVNGGAAGSIDFSLNGSRTDGIVAISRLSTQSTLAPARPVGHTFIGLWSFDATADFENVSLKVRYNDLLAQSLGLNESVLKLWVYDTDHWVRITDSSFARDLTNHTLAGRWDSFTYVGVSAPDPGTATGLLGFAAGWLLRRRRRA